MYLWKISQAVNNDWNTYDSAVVAADTEEEAKMIHPSTGKDIGTGNDRIYSDVWVTDPNCVQCVFLGTAKQGTLKGVIVASFNAG